MPGCIHNYPNLRKPVEDRVRPETGIFECLAHEKVAVKAGHLHECRPDGLSIAGMVDPGVQQHIEQHGLYGAMIPGRRASDTPFTAAAGRLHDEG